MKINKLMSFEESIRWMKEIEDFNKKSYLKEN